jgi:hypothetical protein
MTLHALLDEGARFASEYEGGLSDHRPMALTALAALGGDSARLTAFAAACETVLEPAPPPEPWPAGDAWTGRLGDGTAWPAYRSLFAEWLAHEGPDAVLEQTLPVLMQGVSAAAFHGPIRTACAVASSHAGELVAGLAYWACRHQPLDVAPPRSTPRLPRSLRPPAAAAAGDAPASLDTVLVRLAASLAPLPRERLIVDRMVAVAGQPAFARETGRLDVAEDTLDTLTRRAARLFTATGDFTVLHMVTGCHAVHLLAPFLDDVPAAVAHLQRAWVAAWAASGVGLPDLAAGVPDEPPAWPELTAAAIASDDPHTVKLAWSCRDLERRIGDAEGVFRAASARQLHTAAG